jgi:glutamine---fructose-6-phosphate transaminase (isomerizing)
MCGIVGYVGRQSAAPLLLEGLQRLEYRGYDSAGLALVKNGTLRVHKQQGRVRELSTTLPRSVSGSIGIAHTRWATHGEPSERNAHPQLDESGRVAVVHNGIIENASELRARLIAEGVTLASDTDTELIAHLIARSPMDDLEDAVRDALTLVEGTYGLAVLSAGHPDRIVVARNGSPVVIGIGAKEMIVASDVAALIRHTGQVVHLADGEIATVTRDGFETSTLDRRRVLKVPVEVSGDSAAYEKGAHDTYLRREIADQPDALESALRGRIDERFATSRLDGLDMTARDLRALRRVKLLGCGSAYYAAMAGAHMLESIARIPADAEAASEFRYRNPIIEADTLYIAISQSGETADTLAAVEEIERKGGTVAGIVNCVGSSIARVCGRGVYLHAGPETSVASTKAVSSMLIVLALVSVHLGRVRDLGPSEGKRILSAIAGLPEAAATALASQAAVSEAAEQLAASASSFYVGRVRGYPVALEGAQKLKELSYVHAEAYPASELKHGPLAVVTHNTPVLVVAPSDHLLPKNISTIEQVKARDGFVIALGHEPIPQADLTVTVPRSEPELDPILLGLPLQLIAHDTARLLGRDLDRPRNLAKSVTVE